MAASALVGCSTRENPVQEPSDAFAIRAGLQVLCPAESLGNPVSDIQRAAVIQTALSSCLNYATVASVLRGTEERPKAAQSPPGWKFRHFWPFVKLYAGFQVRD